MTQLQRYPMKQQKRTVVTLGEKATDLLDTLRDRLDILTSAEVVTAALNLYEMHTRPPTGSAPTLEKVTDPVIIARQTALDITRDLCEWETQQGGYGAQLWTDLRIIRDNTAAHTLVEIYDALAAVQEWADLMGGWEAEVWERLADFVNRLAGHVDHMRTIVAWCSPRA